MRAQVGGLYLGIIEKLASRAIQGNEAGLENIRAIGNSERKLRHLLHEKE